MKTIFTQQALVRVWRNLKVLGKVPTSHFGHASVTVKGTYVKGSPDGDPNIQNISFWPNDGAGFGNAFQDQSGYCSDSIVDDKVSEMNKLTAIRLEVAYCKREGLVYPDGWNRALREANKSPLSAPRPGQKQIFDPTTNRALTHEGASYALKDGSQVPVPLYSQSAQAKFYLPGLGAKGAHWGLNTTRMGDWWIAFEKKDPHYRAFSTQKNCVGVVFQALREGGADAIVKLPQVRAYGEPVQVEQYAIALEKELRRLEAQTATSG